MQGLVIGNWPDPPRVGGSLESVALALLVRAALPADASLGLAAMSAAFDLAGLPRLVG